MKIILKPFLKYYLKYLTKICLLWQRPVIIAIAGSTNKPFVKDEIARVLAEMGLSARANPKNFNTEFGLPLAVLDLPSGYNSIKNWLPAIKEAPRKMFAKNFPKYLILSLGTSDPGDIKYLLSIVSPQITVVTDITQRYLEGFQSMDQLVKEYQCLADKTPTGGLLILNHENEKLRSLETGAQKVFFGFSEGADWQAADIADTTTGQKFTLRHASESRTVEVDRFGQHHLAAHLIAQIIKSYVIEQHKR